MIYMPAKREMFL